MSAQIQADIIRALAAACEVVEAYEISSSNLLDDARPLIDGALRFVEPEQRIADARRAVLERLESTKRLIERAAAAAEDRRFRRIAETARAHAVEAINNLQVTVLAQGRINEAGDRVGLGRTGSPLR